MRQSDEDIIDINEIKKNLNLVQKDINNLKIQTLLSGETDSYNAFVEIHAGAGGTESQDWAEMLERMYLKFCDKNEYSYDLIDKQKGEEAGNISKSLLTYQLRKSHYHKVTV